MPLGCSSELDSFRLRRLELFRSFFSPRRRPCDFLACRFFLLFDLSDFRLFRFFGLVELELELEELEELEELADLLLGPYDGDFRKRLPITP